MRKILFEIEVENVGAARRIEALREEIRRLNKEIRGAEIGSPIFHDLIRQLTGAKQETAALKEQQKALNREFQAAKFPKDSLAGLRIEYAKLTEQIKVLSAAERASPFGQSLIANAANVKKQIDGIEQSIGRFTGNVGNYKSTFDGLNNVLLSIGAGFSVNEIIQQNTRLSDSIANVAKTTGLTIEQAEKLAETLKFRDTRTSLADQLKITEIGGQLGIATGQLEDFTAGVDVLNVALGDQFGNVENLTREFAGLRNVLTDFKTGDAADDILKLGNAVNFLEAQGNATGQSIVDFAGRIAGAGVPLGATTDQIIGLSTTLSELSINPERGATAVQRLLVELAKSPALFAQAIGEPVDTFTKLVETDIVGALALVSERIATSSETNTAFATTLDELGIGAQGAIEVFGKLGGSTDLLRQRISEAGQTLQNTDSITREFEVKNNNAAAAVEKLRNAITGALTSTEAQDAIAGIAESLTDLVGALGETFEFFNENRAVAIEFAAALIYLNRQGILAAIPLLRTLGVSLGFLVVNEQGAVIATNSLTTAQGRAAISAGVQATATRALALAQSALPFVAVIAATYALVAAWDEYQESASAAEKAAETLADAQGDIARESAKEISAVKENIATLKFDIDNKDARKKAIESLTAAYPEYLRGMDLEKVSVQELDRLQGQLTESIIRSVAERKKASALEGVAGEIVEQELRIQQGIRDGLPLPVINSLRLRLGELKAEYDAVGQSFNDAFSIGGGVRETTLAQQDLLQFNADLAGQFPALTQETSRAAGATSGLGKEAESTGGKIKGLGDSTKKAKDEIAAQAGSVAALKEQISKLQKQIEAAAPGSPALDGLIKKLDATKAKLRETEQALLASTFKALFGRELVAPEIDVSQQPELTIQPELAFEPDAKEKLLADAKAVKDSVQAALQAVEFPVEIEISEAEKKMQEERRKGNEKLREDEEANAAEAAAKREERIKEAKDAAIEAAQTTANAVFEIQKNNAARELETNLAALDLETQNRIEAAGGNKVKIAAIEKDAAKKRQVIEEEAARERQAIAIKEALINTALAIVKSLPNFVLAGLAAAAGLAQIAVIKSQQFWEGGVAGADELIGRAQAVGLSQGHKIERLQPGIIRAKQNAPRTPHGDTVLAYLAPGEMVLNEPQQNTLRSMFGQDAFALAGVPGESATRRRAGVPAFASGGVVGIVPQNGFAQQVSQPTIVQVESKPSQEQIEAQAVTMGTIIAELVSKGAFDAILLGSDEANRLADRINRGNQNRQG